MELEVSFTMGYLHDELKDTPKQPNSKPLPTFLYSNLKNIMQQQIWLTVDRGGQPGWEEHRPARQAKRRGQVWQEVTGKMEKGWEAARAEGSRARGELKKNLILSLLLDMFDIFTSLKIGTQVICRQVPTHEQSPQQEEPSMKSKLYSSVQLGESTGQIPGQDKYACISQYGWKNKRNHYTWQGQPSHSVNRE